MAFGDNGPRKKSFFERLTVLVVLIMLLVTVGALIFQAVAAVLQDAIKRFFVYVGNSFVCD